MDLTRIDYVSISICMGIWSLPTLGPCDMCLLNRSSSLYPRIKSGFPFLFSLWKVLKSSSKKFSLYDLHMWCKSSPLWFVTLLQFPKYGCIALKSPATSRGALVEMSFWKSRGLILLIRGGRGEDKGCKKYH